MWLFPYDIKTTIFSDSFGSWRPRAAGDATEPLELEIWPERQGEVGRCAVDWCGAAIKLDFALLVASLLLVVRPGAPSSVLAPRLGMLRDSLTRFPEVPCL